MRHRPDRSPPDAEGIGEEVGILVIHGLVDELIDRWESQVNEAEGKDVRCRVIA
jgi:hypothetical protein